MGWERKGARPKGGVKALTKSLSRSPILTAFLTPGRQSRALGGKTIPRTFLLRRREKTPFFFPFGPVECPRVAPAPATRGPRPSPLFSPPPGRPLGPRPFNRPGAANIIPNFPCVRGKIPSGLVLAPV